MAAVLPAKLAEGLHRTAGVFLRVGIAQKKDEVFRQTVSIAGSLQRLLIIYRLKVRAHAVIDHRQPFGGHLGVFFEVLRFIVGYCKNAIGPGQQTLHHPATVKITKTLVKVITAGYQGMALQVNKVVNGHQERNRDRERGGIGRTVEQVQL
jgi:apolipoprotein N-acyltransferase